MVGIGGVAADLDRQAGKIHVPLAVEPRIEGADELAAPVVDGGGEPALCVIAQLFPEELVADDAAQWRDHINQRQCEHHIGNASRHHMAQRPELRVERHAEKHEPSEPQHRADGQLGRVGQQSQERKHQR